MTLRPTVSYERFDVVKVPFPLTDKAQIKKRPALILYTNAAFNAPAGHSVLAMITSAKNPAWPLDVGVTHLTAAGLPAPSVVRMKLFTLDHRFVLGKIGRLDASDEAAVTQVLKKLCG
ncbi:MAG: type II toxin-antitoxin system PemK/MazF family toxin [Pseudomonadota bacterium]